VANYDATINVRVSGTQAVDGVFRRVEQLESLVRSLNARPLNLANSRGWGQLADRFGVAARELNNLKDSFINSEQSIDKFNTTSGRTIANARAIADSFKFIAANSDVATNQFREFTLASLQAGAAANTLGRQRLRVLNEELTGVNNADKTIGGRGVVSTIIGSGREVTNSIAALSAYRSELEDTLQLVEIGGTEFRALEEAIAGVEQRLGSARLAGQTSAITPAAGPASRIDTVASFEKRASFAKVIADQEYKLLTAGQQIVQAKLKETQQDELQNRLAQASEALARGELDVAKRLTNEIRNQRILYERANRAEQALMRPTSMTAGAAESVTGRRPGGLPPVPGSPAALRAAAQTPTTAPKSQVDNTIASQKRLNNLFASAQILEQKTIQLKSKGIDLSSQEATIQKVITSIQQNGTTATKQYLDALDAVLNSLRNELKLQKEILTTQQQQNRTTKPTTAAGKKQDSGKLKEAVGNAIIGGAFPLLFGQGIGAAAGGGLGGFAGGMVGGNFGFGLSLVGTAVGSQLDAIAQRAVDLGQALLKPTENIDKIIAALGIANTSLGSSIGILRSFGYESTAASVAVEELESKLGVKTVESIKMLGAEFTEFQNALATLSLRLTAFVSGPLASFINLLTSVVGSISNAEAARQVGAGLTGEKRKAFEADITRMTGGAGFSGNISDKALQELTQKYDPAQTKAVEEASKARERAEGIIVQHMQRQESLAQKVAGVEAGRLSARRDTLAADQKSLDVLRISNEIEAKRTELIYEQENSKRRILGFELRLLEQQKTQAQAEKQNAIIEAQRQIRKDVTGLIIEQIEIENDLFAIRNKTAELLHGEEVSIAAAQNSLKKKTRNELEILHAKERVEKLGVNEIEVLKNITAKYNGLVQVVKERYKNEKLALQQQEAQYKLTRLMIEQDRQQSTRQATTQFRLERQRLLSFQDPAGTGFFGGALLNQKLNLSEYNATLAEYNKQLADIEARRQIPGLNPDTAMRLADESAKLRDQIAVYQEYQPAIIQARLEQEKFNTILNATGSVIDTVVDGFTGMIEGTTTAQEAFASFLRSVADMLMNTVKQMIAQYIALGIARQFAGFGGALAANTGGFAGMTVANNALGEAMTFRMMGFADGGRPPVGRPSIVGERGPELFVPSSSGTIVPNHMLGGGSVNVVVNVDASGSTVQGDNPSANQMGRVIGAAVQAEIVKMQRPGGLLASTR
jgi:hypothetical protein